jgi:methylmalonyl-CoA/ethylmalonyl-CoA epimerase
VALRGIHHVGVAVSDLDEAIATYGRLFGAVLEHRAALAEQGVEAAFLQVGSGRVELVAAAASDSTVGRFLANRGLAAAGASLIDETPRRGLLGLEVAFVHPDAVHGVLTEVVSGG